MVVVVVGPTRPPKYGGAVQQLFLRTPADGFPPSSRHPGRLVPPLHLTSKCSTSTGAVQKSVTFRCVFMLVQLNKCVVCGSDLQRGHSGDGCLSSSILFRYECSMGHLFVLSWASVRRVTRGSVISE